MINLPIIGGVMNDQYDAAFRVEAIRLALSSSQSIAKTARDLGVKEGTLYNWVSAAKSQSPTIIDEQGNKGWNCKSGGKVS